MTVDPASGNDTIEGPEDRITALETGIRNGAPRQREDIAQAESEDRYRSLMMALAEGVILQDGDAAIVACNDSATRILGLTADQLHGRTSFDPRWRAVHEDGSPFAGETHPAVETLRTGEARSGVIMGVHRPDGSLIWISVGAQPIFKAGNPRPYNVVATIQDITERRRIEADLRWLACHDSLTELPNRASFIEAVSAALGDKESDPRRGAVLSVDIDGFKGVNDTLGHGAGDALLKTLARRLENTFGNSAVVARLGSDEFGILLANVAGDVEIDRVASAVQHAINDPVNLEVAEIRMSASVGVAVRDIDVPDAETLLLRADIALYRAREHGGGAVTRFTKAMDAAVQRRFTLGRDLHTAIEAGQLRLLYQPQADAETGAIMGVEALVRWRHPSCGVVGPDEFIPIAENIGLAPAIGRWVIGEACSQIRAWIDMGLSPPPVGVNLSAKQFLSRGELERDLEEAMARHRVTPGGLELELTETVLMESSVDHNDTIMRLRQRGFSLSIDDFGSGYSSLDYLRRFPVDRIKIDQNFVRDSNDSPGNEAIVRAIIGLAKQLGVGVIAEGVETRRQRDIMWRWDCRDMQGYYFSRPMEAAPLTEFLKTNQRLPI